MQGIKRYSIIILPEFRYSGKLDMLYSKVELFTLVDEKTFIDISEIYVQSRERLL